MKWILILFFYSGSSVKVGHYDSKAVCVEHTKPIQKDWVDVKWAGCIEAHP